MDLRLLGPVEAFVDGHPVPLGPPKQRALLAMLALDAGRTVSADRLVEGLWGEEPPTSAAKMVQLYVSQLRRVMDGNGAEIVTRGRGYELQIVDDGLDVGRFTRLLDQGEPREALLLWRGPPLADVADEPFAALEIRRLEDLRLRATEEAIDADLDAGRHAEVIGELDALVAAHPLRERLHEQRMLALYRAGRQSEALDAYRDARRVLVDEIGVEPRAELQRLQRAILEQDPSLELPVDEHSEEPPISAPSHRARRGLVVLSVAVPIVLMTAFAITTLSGSVGLSRVDENAVGEIDAESGRITRQYPVGRGPGALAAGAGSVWVANSHDGTVTRLRPGRREAVTIDVGGEPTGAAFGAGSLWVADGQGRTVAQIDPYTNRVLQRFDVGNAAHAVAVDYGAVWATSAVDGTVARIDLARGEVTDRIAVGNRPTAIATGLGGIWVASDAEASVVRIDPRSRTAVARIPTGNAPSSIAVGAGAVWVANRMDGNVSRIDPTSERVTDAIRVGREPRSVVADDRAVWVASAGDGWVAELDPNAPRVIRRVKVANSPVALALADGVVWSTVLPRSSTHRGGRLRVTFSASPGDRMLPPDPSTLDPLASLTYDGLIGYRRVGGSAGGALVPNLARELPEKSPNGLTYVFRLRPNVRFSTGRVVRPADVRRSIERLIAMATQASDEYLPLLGARECTPKHCDLAKAITLNDTARTVTVRLERPDPELLHKLANALVVPAGSPLRETDPPPPGTGPYRVKSWGASGGVLERNPHFRVASSDRPDGYPNEISMHGMPLKDQIAAVDQGRSDVAAVGFGLEPQVVGARTRLGVRMHFDGFPQTWFVFLNTQVPPFDDARVRRALNYAVDRGRVGELLGSHETHKPTCQLLPPGFQGFTPSCRFTVGSSGAGVWTAPDLAKARRLIAASGTRGMKVEFWGSEPWAPLSGYFGTLLRRIGYRPRVRTFDDLALILEKSTPRSPQAGVWGWIADSAGPMNFLTPLISCAGAINLSHFCDERIDAAMRDAAAARAPDAVAKWRRVEDELASQSPTVPLVSQNAVSLTSERVGNYQFHTFFGPLLDQMWVK